MRFSTLNQLLEMFPNVWSVDFEFTTVVGDIPQPICLVAKNIQTSEVKRIWLQDEENISSPFGSNDCIVCFYAMAELSCLRALCWPLPNVIDLYVEFKNLTNVETNSKELKAGRSLLAALSYYGLSTIGAEEKDEWRKLCIRGGPYSEQEKLGILDYCFSDVGATEKLFHKMIPHLDLPRALFRGDYERSLSSVEANGIPMDQGAYQLFQRHKEPLKLKLQQSINEHFILFEDGVFKAALFENLIQSKNIFWPRTPTNKLKTDSDTFKEHSKSDKLLNLIRETNDITGRLKTHSLEIGGDGRARFMLSPFGSKTSRNQPSTSKFPFGLSAALRSFIKPAEGMALAYVDYSQQELGIAAALSGDPKMKAAYDSGDPYLQFAKDAKLAPKNATKKSHSEIRDQAKQLILAIQYGMGVERLAQNIGQSVIFAQRLLDLHRSTYSKFWAWSDQVEHLAFMCGKVSTNFGWHLTTRGDFNKRTVRNFPMQANGAEILRVTIILLEENGIKVCAPVHDAVLVEAPISEIDAVTAKTQQIMAKASKIVLKDIELRSDAKIIRYPARYDDPRGTELWTLIKNTINELEGKTCI